MESGSRRLHLLLGIIVTGIVGGIFLRSFFDFDTLFTPLAFSLIPLLLFFFLYRHRSVIAVFLFVLGVLLGIVRFEVSEAGIVPLPDRFVKTPVTIYGEIVDEPTEKGATVAATALLSAVEGDDNIRTPVFGVRVKMFTDSYTPLVYGDRFSARGVLEPPGVFYDKERKRTVDYAELLRGENIEYVMRFPEVSVLGSGGMWWKRELFELKKMFLEGVSRVLPEPHASLLGGLVVGAKQSLGKPLLQKFRDVGLIHIVVLSGYNVTIVAEALMRFFSFLPRISALLIGSGSIVLFAIMVGAGATVVRASIMALLVILARATGRTYDVLRGLFIAGFLMVVVNPKILVFDTSFQLSFLATLGLLLFPPIIERHFHFIPTKFQLRELALATISTQLFVLPLLLYKMGTLSVVALPVNLLVLGFIPLTMLFGFLAGVIGAISVPLSFPFAFASFVLLEYELRVVDLFAALPFAALSVVSFPLWAVFALYGFYGWVVWRFWDKVRLSSSVCN